MARAAAPEAPPPGQVVVRGGASSVRAARSAIPLQIVDLERERLQQADAGTVLARAGVATFRSTGGLGAFTSVTLDGLGKDRVRLFLDGVPLSLSGFGLGLGTVPVGMLKRVEVFRGVVPARYGADALGGAIDLISDTDFSGTRASASYQVGSFGTARLNVLGSHRDGDTGLYARAYGFVDESSNAYRVPVEVPASMGRPVEVMLPRFHDAYAARGGGVQAGLVDRPWAKRLIATVFHSRFEKELQSNLVMTVPYGQVVYGKEATGANLRYAQDLGGDVQLVAVAGAVLERTRFEDLAACRYDWYGRCGVPLRGEIGDRPSDLRVRDHTAFARVSLAAPLGESQKLRVSIAPTSVFRDGRERALPEGSYDPLRDGRAVHQFVPGVEHQLEALDGALENVTFAKFYVQSSHAEELLSSNAVRTVRATTTVPGLGEAVRLTLSPGLFAKASYEWATRLPTADELFGDGVLTVQNLTLAAERSHNVNTSVAYEGGAGRLGRLRGELGGFARFADDFIVHRPYDAYLQHQNVSQARILGIATSTAWTSPGEHVELGANFSFQDPRNTSDSGPLAPNAGDRLPNQPWLFAGASARLNFERYLGPSTQLSLVWFGRYVHAFYRSWESDGRDKQTIPSQLIQDVALTHAFRTETRTVAMSVEVANVADAAAYDFIGQRRPGRALFAKASIELR